MLDAVSEFNNDNTIHTTNYTIQTQLQTTHFNTYKITKHELWLMQYRNSITITNYKLQTTKYKLRTTNYKLHTTKYKRQHLQHTKRGVWWVQYRDAITITNYILQNANYKLQTTNDQLHASTLTN